MPFIHESPATKRSDFNEKPVWVCVNHGHKEINIFASGDDNAVRFCLACGSGVAEDCVYPMWLSDFNPEDREDLQDRGNLIDQTSDLLESNGIDAATVAKVAEIILTHDECFGDGDFKTDVLFNEIVTLSRQYLDALGDHPNKLITLLDGLAENLDSK